MDEPWTLIRYAHPSLDLVWSYAQHFCCEQLFRDQKSGLLQLESSGLRDPERIDRLLLVVAIAELVGSLQGYAISFSGLSRQVDPHWQRGMSFVRIGRPHSTNSSSPMPPQPCRPRRGVQRRWKQLWFTRVELPPRLAQAIPLAVS